MSESQRQTKGGLFGLIRNRRTDVSEEEIRDMVDDATELAEDEKRMINEIIDLGDTTVREIMQPRVDVIMVEDDETVRAAVERMHGTGYSRLPICHEDIDQVVGVVSYKDLMMPILDGSGDDCVMDYAREPYFVPETKDVIPLLSEMRESRLQMAIVVDEYGGTDGIVTMEDILEEIVGDILDETDSDDDAEKGLVKAISETEWIADGRLSVEEALKLGWPVSESDDYETIAGWILALNNAVPKVGAEFTVDGYRFRVDKMRRRRVARLHVFLDTVK